MLILSHPQVLRYYSPCALPGNPSCRLRPLIRRCKHCAPTRLDYESVIALRPQAVEMEESVASRKIIPVFVLTLVCLQAAEAVHAQGATAAKIGTLNVQVAISTCAEGKQAAADLQAQFLPRQQELETMNKQVSDLQQRLNAGATLSDAERSGISVQGTRLSQRLERKNNEYQDDLRESQSEIMNRIGRKLMEVVHRYAQEGNYTVILDSSGQNSSLLLFAAKNIDVTEDIIRLYDQANPAKGAIATPATPTTKPAPKPATSPPAKP
jgi:Skp family chaperone for outer membrane proteins